VEVPPTLTVQTHIALSVPWAAQLYSLLRPAEHPAGPCMTHSGVAYACQPVEGR
jgi:hypothetical protein